MALNAFQTVKAMFAPADDQLMWRVQMADDPHAFAELVRRWESRLQGLCTRMLGDPGRGEDLAQETFARLFARRKCYRAGGSFSAYVWRIAVNLCHDERRRAQRRPEIPVDMGDGESEAPCVTVVSDDPGPDEQAANEELGEAVRLAVGALSESHRAIVVLRHYEGLKFREIAEVLSLPEGTVKTRMTEALNQLARLLKPSLGLKGALSPNRRTRPQALMVM